MYTEVSGLKTGEESYEVGRACGEWMKTAYQGWHMSTRRREGEGKEEQRKTALEEA